MGTSTSSFRCCRRAETTQDLGTLDNESKNLLLIENATGVRILTWINLVLVYLVYAASLIQGMAIPTPAGVGTAVPHIIWMILNSFALTLTLVSTYIGFENDQKNLKNKLTGAMIFVVIAIIGNLAHFILAIIELTQCVTDLCIDDYPFLMALTIVLGVMIFWQLWILLRLNVLRVNLLRICTTKGGLEPCEPLKNGTFTNKKAARAKLESLGGKAKVESNIGNYWNQQQQQQQQRFPSVTVPLLRVR